MITVKLKCTNLIGLSDAWRVNECESHELAKIIMPGDGGGGKKGAVRIIFPGTTRSFPSTCTGDL